MCLVLGPQAVFLFELRQAFVNLGVFEGVTAVDGRLVCVGACLPLLTDLAVVAFQLFEKPLGLLVGNQRPDSGGYVILENRELQIVAFEIQLRVGGFGAAAKTAFADGLDFADAVLRVMDGLAFSNVNREFPSFFRPLQKCGESRIRINILQQNKPKWKVCQALDRQKKRDLLICFPNLCRLPR